MFLVIMMNFAIFRFVQMSRAWAIRNDFERQKPEVLVRNRKQDDGKTKFVTFSCDQMSRVWAIDNTFGSDKSRISVRNNKRNTKRPRFIQMSGYWAIGNASKGRDTESQSESRKQRYLQHKF
jgi:hypothetical protein